MAASCFFLLTGCLFVLVLFAGTMAVTSSIWEKVAQRTVTSAMATVPVVSRLHCVLRCQQMGGCGSAAFDSASGVCYLQPTHRRFAEGDAGQPVDVVTIESASECKVSEAPYVPNAHVSWRPMSSALEGDVSCDEDYMLSADVTAQLSCEPETGIWARDMPAFCAKFAWSHSTAQTGVLYPVPRPVHGGWCLQLNGSSSGTRFAINLSTTNEEDIVLQVDARFKYGGFEKTTMLNYRQEGVWGTGVPLQHPQYPFPFVEHVPFEIVITAVTSKTFKIQVNGKHYKDFTGRIPISEVASVKVNFNVLIKYLSLWC